MSKKRILLALLCIVMALCCIFLVACDSDSEGTETPNGSTENNGGSNGDNTGNNGGSNTGNNGGNNTGDNGGNNTTHTHSYTSAVTKNATCTVAGVRTYSCSCGDSYTEAIAAIGHDYKVAISKYPTATESGTKIYTCQRTDCTHSYNEEIVALTVRLPQVSKLIAPLFNDKNATLKLADEGKIIFVQELDNYQQTYFTDAYKTFVTIEVAESCIGGKGDVFSAYVKLKASMVMVNLDGSISAVEVAEPTKRDGVLELDLYVNGENISVDFKQEYLGDEDAFQGDYNVYGLLSSAIGGALGMNEDALLGIVNAIIDMEEYLPLFEGIVTSAGALAMPDHLLENLQALAAFLSDDAIAEEAGENGTTVFTLDIGAIKNMLAEYADATVAEIIDAQYGEGATAAITQFLNALPDMKLKDVAMAAIAFAENYGVNIEEAYEMVDMYVYLIAGEEIDIAAAIEQHYEKTLAQLLAESRGIEDTAAFAAGLKEQIATLTQAIPALTIDNLYNLFKYGNPEYIPEGESAVYSITTDILAALEVMAENCEISATVGTVGEDLEILELRYDLGNVLALYTFDGNGGYNVTLTMNEQKVFEGKLTVTENGAQLGGELTLNGEKLTLEATIGAEAQTIAVKHNGNDLLTMDYTFDANGVLIAADEKLYTCSYHEHDQCFVYDQIFSLEFQKTADGYTFDSEIGNVSVNATADAESASLVIVREEYELLTVDMAFDPASGAVEAIDVKIYGFVTEEQGNLVSSTYTCLASLEIAKVEDAYTFTMEIGDARFEGTVEIAENELSISLELDSISMEQTMAALDVTVNTTYEAEELSAASLAVEFRIMTDAEHSGALEVTLSATEINGWLEIDDVQFCTLAITTDGNGVVTGVDFEVSEEAYGEQAPYLYYAYDPETGVGEAELDLAKIIVEVSFDKDSFEAEMFGRDMCEPGDCVLFGTLTVALDESGAPTEIVLDIDAPAYDPEQEKYVLLAFLDANYKKDADGSLITFALARGGIVVELAWNEEEITLAARAAVVEVEGNLIEVTLKKVDGGVALEWAIASTKDEGAVALTKTEKGISLDVNIPKLSLSSVAQSAPLPNYSNFDLDESDRTYTVMQWMAFDFTLLFEITDAE